MKHGRKDELRKMSEADAVVEHNAHDKNLVRWGWSAGTDLSDSDVEVISIQKVNEAYERLLRSDVKYRFSIDMASLKSE
jgi:hypothetical protein